MIHRIHMSFDQLAHSSTILKRAVGKAAPERAGSLPQFWTCAAATQRQARHEMERAQTPIRPMNLYRYVAYSTPPKLDAPKRNDP